MRVKVFETSHTVKPKQKKGKLVVPAYVITNEAGGKPKPGGVILNLEKFDRVVKTDRSLGVIIQKIKNTKIIKQWD
tara:strand:- start:523 stop:750 length:228 start_codon:yes stop_codon:yes gene_type:complete